MNKRRRVFVDHLYGLATRAGVFDAALKHDAAERKRLGLSVRNISSSESELLIYGDIGMSWWGDGITANDVAEALKTITGSQLNVRVNSNGGDVFHGVAIHTLLARHPAYVTAWVDGIAASAASFLIQAADSIKVARNAFVMIHEASTFSGGNKRDLRETADLLEKVDQNIADVYAERAGDSVAQWTARMEEETWYTGQEAVEAGLADEIAGEAEAENRAAKLTTATLANPTIAARFAHPPAPPTVVTDETEKDEPVEDLLAEFEAGEKGVTERPVTDTDHVAPGGQDDNDFRFAMSMAHWLNTGVSGA